MKRSLKVLLAERLSAQELSLVYRSYDIVGDIAIIRVPESLEHVGAVVADALMQVDGHVKTVLLQTGAVTGEFRLRRLRFIAGEKKTETVHKEFGCLFKVDLAKCYFSPRLSYERMRITRLVQPQEIVVNMFAGVGCFSILMAKHSEVKKVYSIDVNPSAVWFMQENVRINRVQNRVVPIEGNAKEIIAQRLSRIADRVVMPLPSEAHRYLDYALLALKTLGGWIHYYHFEHAQKGEDPVEKVKVKIVEKLRQQGVKFEVASGRVVRATGPNWHQVVLDVQVTGFK